MKKNPLSVWTFPYRKSYYLTHPWKLFKDIYWNIRNFWHRGRYGYAYVDVWNMCDWAPRVIAEALRYLRDHSHGYPGVSPWETPEKWHDHLDYLANQFQRCADFQDFVATDERNEYKDDFEAMSERTHREYKDENGFTVWTSERTPADEELAKKYFERAAELAKVDRMYAREVFEFFGENLGRYWD